MLSNILRNNSLVNYTDIFGDKYKDFSEYKYLVNFEDCNINLDIGDIHIESGLTSMKLDNISIPEYVIAPAKFSVKVNLFTSKENYSNNILNGYIEKEFIAEIKSYGGNLHIIFENNYIDITFTSYSKITINADISSKYTDILIKDITLLQKPNTLTNVYQKYKNKLCYGYIKPPSTLLYESALYATSGVNPVERVLKRNLKTPTDNYLIYETTKKTGGFGTFTVHNFYLTNNKLLKTITSSLDLPQIFYVSDTELYAFLIADDDYYSTTSLYVISKDNFKQIEHERSIYILDYSTIDKTITYQVDLGNPTGGIAIYEIHKYYFTTDSIEVLENNPITNKKLYTFIDNYKIYLTETTTIITKTIWINGVLTEKTITLPENIYQNMNFNSHYYDCSYSNQKHFYNSFTDTWLFISNTKIYYINSDFVLKTKNKLNYELGNYVLPFDSFDISNKDDIIYSYNKIPIIIIDTTKEILSCLYIKDDVYDSLNIEIDPSYTDYQILQLPYKIYILLEYTDSNKLICVDLRENTINEINNKQIQTLMEEANFSDILYHNGMFIYGSYINYKFIIPEPFTPLMPKHGYFYTNTPCQNYYMDYPKLFEYDSKKSLVHNKGIFKHYTNYPGVSDWYSNNSYLRIVTSPTIKQCIPQEINFEGYGEKEEESV